MSRSKDSHDSFAARHPRRPSTAMKTAAVALMVAGVILVFLGVYAMRVASADVSHLFEDAVADRTPWILLFGVAVFVTGVAGLFPAFRRRDRE